MMITKRLAGFILAPVHCSELARARAARCVVDTLAVTVAGSAEPGLRSLERAVQPTDDPGSAAVPWNTRRYREEDACLLFGMASHILDYDDVSMLAVCHPSAPVLSALWALASRSRATGAAFLDAYVVGTEVLIRSGQAMGFRHYDLGFHATATLGSLGAAAACARLLGLDRARTCQALSIAASLSAGMRKNFGSMVKSLHVGQAAANGLRAARLAEAGIEGSEEVLEGHGWLWAFSGGMTDIWPRDLVPGQPFAIEDPGFEQKRYPCCYLMHKIIQATLELKNEHGLSLEGLREARVDMFKGGTAPLIHPMPRTGLAAKFSGPYAVAGALADGRMDLQSFEVEAVLRPAIQASMAKVTVVEGTMAPTRGSDLGSAPVTVTLTYADGRTCARTVSASPGSPDDPLSDANLLDKWRDCLSRGLSGLPAASVDALFEAGMRLDASPSTSAWLGGFRRGE